MKRFLGLICGLIFLLSMTGCGSKNSPKMYIAPAELTQKEKNIAELLGSDGQPLIFDFTADDSLQSITIHIYELKNGSWELFSGGGNYAFSDSQGRIALSFDKLPYGFRTAVQNQEGTLLSSSHHAPAQAQKLDDMSWTTSSLGEKQEIVYEQEIPLLIQIITSKNEVTSYIVDYFHHPEEYEKLGYEHVYAITARFCQNPLS